MQRLLPPALVVLLLVLMLIAAVAAPWPALTWPVRLIGLVPIGSGIALASRHARLFDHVGTNIKTFDNPDVLVQEGAFTWTRNPMYLGFVLVLVGAAIALGSATALAGPMVFFVIADRWYIPFEEHQMTEVFGSSYQEYQHRVRRWIGTKPT